MRPLRFILIRLGLLLAPLTDYLDTLAVRWADRRLLAQVNRMRTLVQVAIYEKNPNYLRDLRRGVAWYRDEMEHVRRTHKS